MPWVNSFVCKEKDGNSKASKLSICLDTHDLDKHVVRELYCYSSMDDMNLDLESYTLLTIAFMTKELLMVPNLRLTTFAHHIEGSSSLDFHLD